MAAGRERIRLRDIKRGKKWKGRSKQKEMAEETNIVDEEIAFITLENPKGENPEPSIEDEEHNF